MYLELLLGCAYRHCACAKITHSEKRARLTYESMKLLGI